MKETLIGLIKLIACLLMLMFAEGYFFEFLAHIGINISNFTPLVRELIVLGLYILMFGIVYLIFNDHIKTDLKNYKRRLLSNVLMSVAFFAVLVIFLWMVNLLVATIASSMDISYQGLIYYNIFNQEFDLILVSFIIRQIILMPMMLCFIYVLGVYDVIDSKRMTMFLTGLLGAIVAGIGMSGTLTTIFFNVIPYFVIFFALSYIYHKNRYNVWFSAITFVLYGMFASLLIQHIT